MTARDSRSVVDDGRDDLGYRIVREVAAVEGVDPLDLSPPLYEIVNVEALQSLFRAHPDGGRVTFSYQDHRVTVDADGTVSLGD